jgi:PAS domain S-box-containing protein
MIQSQSQGESLRRSEARFHLMVDEVEDYAILMLDRDGIIQNWNKGAEKIKGYKREEIIGKNFRIFYTKENRDMGLPDQLLDEAVKAGRVSHYGWRVRKDGTKFWGNVVITALHDEKNNVIGFLKITRDLTERKEAEERQLYDRQQLEKANEDLRRSEERYLKMVEEVVDYAIMILDKDGNVRNWNKGVEKIKGYTREEIIGKNFRIFYTKEDRERGLPDQLLQEAINSGRVSHEGWRVRKDGTNFWGSIVLTALHDENKNIIGFTKVTRDLTEKKMADDRMLEYAARLELKNEELEQFAYVASHDIQEPLRKIIAFGDLLQLNCGETLAEQGKEYVLRMQNASKRMMQLIDTLLTFSRVSRDSLPLKLTDLNEIITQVVNDLDFTIKDKNARITIDRLPEIMGRPLQLQQLFQNLISNSLKFNESKIPEIHITSDTIKDNPEEYYRIHVKDNGIGFNNEFKERIFESFQRLHGKAEYPGSGLGLAICKKIAEGHGGSIIAEGEEGKGADFIVIFPRVVK